MEQSLPQKQTPVQELRIKCDTTAGEFRTGALIASRRVGTLQSLPAVIVVAAALLIAGIWSFGWLSSRVIPAALCLSCPALLAVFFIVEPRNIAHKAGRDFVFYRLVSQSSSVVLAADELIGISEEPPLRTAEPYALMAECIETPKLFVIIRARERVTVIPKRCLPPQRSDEICSHIRHTFARKRRVMRGWIF